MTIPSHTPEGRSRGCPNCGARVRIEPSALFGDMTCAGCGGLLWFLHLEPELRVYERSSSRPIRDQVVAFISEHLGVEPEIASDSTFFLDDLGTDSLNTIELVMDLERELRWH